MRILFISTLNLATNPRFYKEIMTAKNAGIEPEVICFEFRNWSYEYNKKLLESLGDCKVHIIQGNRKPILPWAWSVVKERLFRIAARYLTLKEKFLSQAVTRRSDLILNVIHQLKGPFDLVVGHNPGALYPASVAAKKFNCKCGFDVEDYHPGEGDDKNVQRLTKMLMNQFLPEMDYVTFAAPLMREKHIADIGLSNPNWHVILNLFPENQFCYSESDRESPLQIVWFSQNVNYKRGLENWIPALEQFKGEIELTLIGNKKEPFYSDFIKESSFIKYLEPMEQAELNRKICTYDIGLAIEGGKDYNNIIALSNKLITYFQAGLYILATDTPGQKEFLKTNPHSGMIISTAHEGFVDKLSQIIASKDSIRRTKAARFRNAQQFNWESESQKLLRLWSSLSGH